MATMLEVLYFALFILILVGILSTIGVLWGKMTGSIGNPSLSEDEEPNRDQKRKQKQKQVDKDHAMKKAMNAATAHRAIHEFDLEHALSESGSSVSAARDLAEYANCSEEKAEKTVRAYLESVAPSWATQYAGWSPAYLDGSFCMRRERNGKTEKDAWIAGPHPICEAHASEPSAAAAALYDFLFGTRCYPYGSAYGYLDCIEYDGWGTKHLNGMETADRISFHAWESYSIHDGGGGDAQSVAITFIPDAIPPTKLQKGTAFKSGAPMPPHEGFWIKDDTLYLVNPFFMTGVFAFKEDRESWDLSLDGDDSGRTTIVEMPADADAQNVLDYDFKRAFAENESSSAVARDLAECTGCSVQDAEDAVQEYLQSREPSLAARYLGWNLDYEKGEAFAEWRQGDSRDETWLTIPHPMCDAHAKDSRASAQAFFDHFGRGERLIRAQGHEDRAEYLCSYGGWGKMRVIEAADRLDITATIQDSYHDGGGSFEDSASLVFAPDVAPPEMLETDNTINGMKIPPNKGHWTVGETLYLLNPLHMEGVFSFQETMRSEESAGSGVEIRSIGRTPTK